MASFEEREGGPMGPGVSAAITMNEMVGMYQEAGFTRAEALYIVTAISVGNPGVAPTPHSHQQAAGELDQLD